jgi:hypothetical protein
MFETDLWNEQVEDDLKSNKPCPYGLCAGKVVVPQDLDAPLPEDVIAFFDPPLSTIKVLSQRPNSNF